MRFNRWRLWLFMIIADEILVSIFNASNYSQTLENEIARKSNQGDDVCELEWKYILIGEWVRILTDFYENNFDTQGQIIAPAHETITLAEAQNIMSQIEIALGNNTYPLLNTFQLGVWIEALGFIWDGNDTWYDVPELT